MLEYRSNAADIAMKMSGSLIGEDCEIEAISTDTREKLECSFCFIAIKGERFDGHQYIEQAIKNGASLIVSERKIEKDVPIPIIYVKNTVRALGLLAKNTKRKAKVIGVTGSVGKTSTKDLIISVLKEKYSVIGTEKNFNNEIGVPMTLLSVKNEDYCVLEFGARKKGDIKWLSFIAEPSIVVITNCGTSHIEFFGSEEAIFKEKTKIINENCCTAIVPSEKRFIEHNYRNVKPIFIGSNGDFSYKKIKIHNDGIVGNLFAGKKRVIRIKYNTISKNSFENTIYAYVVGHLCGLSKKKIKLGIKKCKTSKHRLEILNVKTNIIIDDTYNASYESTISSIDALSELSKLKRKDSVCILGDMLELGEKSKELHYKIGCYCKDKNISELYASGNYANEIISGNGFGTRFLSLEDITESIKKRKNCVFLIKASRKMGFEKIVEEMKDIFDEY
ncbi:MAG: UDP-N-acetylmuramoyl-tripeptide--D-alanyl-D-alanine ligase [Clostridia bacterium]|nr:UDP-N-acetylmuramoyl-tripeptide--D-alanyl-D-alanine ligase [Clostridia bacterium]